MQHEGTPETTITFAKKVASAASSGFKKVGSIASQGAKQLASSSSSSSAQPRDTSLLLGDGTSKKDFYTPNTEPRDTSLLLGDGTKKEYFSTVNTKPRAMAKPSKKLTKAGKTLDEEYDDLMADVKSKPKQAPKASQIPNPVSKTKFTKSYATTEGTQIPPSRIGIRN